MTGIRTFGLFAMAALAAVPLAAVSAQQPLPVEAGTAWTHAHSGITIPATLSELVRMRAMSFAAPELDISQSFGSSDGKQQLTVYIFRNTNGSVPLWFAGTSCGERAQGGFHYRGGRRHPQHRRRDVRGRRLVCKVAGILGHPVGRRFVGLDGNRAGRNQTAAGRPGSGGGADHGLRSAVDLPRRFGGFDAAGFRPDGRGPGTGRAHGARWCLNSVFAGNRTVYRPAGTRDGYLLAMGDNGKALAVQSQASGRYYSVNLVTAAQTFQLVAQDRLPSPKRVLDLVGGDRGAQATATWPPR